MPVTAAELVVPFSRLTRGDVGWAGGKGANLGELTAAGLPVPGGFVVGAPAYAATQKANRLREPLESALSDVDVDDTSALHRAAETARRIVHDAHVPEEVERAIRRGYGSLAEGDGAPVAVRSSATSEDTASASFAGMNESFLNIRGSDAVVEAVRDCWASLFGARTIFYRVKRGLPLAGMEIAVVVQRQIEALRAGVMFTADPAGDPRTLVIEAALGLGESVVSGAVTPDRYVVEKAGPSVVRREVHDKALAVQPQPEGGTRTRRVCDAEAAAPALSDDQVLELAELGLRIESHYGSAQDTEWAFDPDGTAWILQARPVTTGPASGAAQASVDGVAPGARHGAPLVRGLAAAPGNAAGAARVITTLEDAGALEGGDVLVAPMTAPDWVPLMRRAAALVTDSGGMTCHAAIVARELGIPCVVGTGDATKILRDGESVAVDGDRGLVLPDGVTAGPAAAVAATPTALPGPTPSATGTQLLVNLSEPSQAQRAAALPVDGVGLLRAEMMLLEALDGEHPRELLESGRGADVSERMAHGLTTFAEAFAGRPITYRTIDFRTNEFRGLRGGDRVEPVEANPMIGYRGALRAIREPDLLGLELDAVRRVWDAGHRNLHLMIPFVRSARELDRVHALVAASGLLDRRGFELWIMAEVPSVLFELPAYAAIGIDGISIGSNDLTQLLLGADRDSALLGDTFDERDPAVQAAIHRLIEQARDLGLGTSLCGQAPSVHPEYAELLVRAGIDAVSVSVDAVDRTRRLIERAERRLLLDGAAGR